MSALTNLLAQTWPYISVPFGAMIPWLYASTKRVLFTKPMLKTVFGFDPSDKVTIIVPTMPNPELGKKEFSHYSTLLEGVFCPQQITELITNKTNQFPNRLSIRMSEGVGNSNLSENVIIFSGPNYNSVSREVLEKHSESVKFVGHELYFPELGKAYSTKTIESDTKFEDYAIILKSDGIWGENSKCLCLMGCRTFGTQGAAWALRQSDISRALISSIKAKKAQRWAACLKISVTKMGDETLRFSNASVVDFIVL